MQYLLMIYRNEAEHAKMDAATRQENDGGIWRLHPVHHPERQFQGRRRLQPTTRRPPCGFAMARR